MIGFRGTANAPAVAGPVTVAVPPGTVSGDVMYGHIWYNVGVGNAGAPPAGWVLLRRGTFNASTYSHAVFRRVAGGAEPVNYVFDNGTSNFTFGYIDSFSGVDPVTPEDVVTPASFDNLVTGTITWPDVNPATDRTWHLAFVAARFSLVPIVGPAGYTIRGTAGPNGKASQEASIETSPPNLISGVSATVTADSYSTISVLLRPILTPQPFGLVEGIAKSVKAALTTYVPTSRARVEAALALAAGSILDPAEIVLGQHQNHAAYPAIEIEAMQHAVETDALNYHKAAFTVAIIVIVTAPATAPTQTSDPETDLTLLVWRYERIIIDALMAARNANVLASGGVAFGLDLQGELIDYSPIRFIRDDLFARDIFIPTICTIEEGRT